MIPAVDRLSRDTTDFLVIAREMQQAVAGIRSLAEPFLDATSDSAAFVFAILGVAAKLERTARGRADATARRGERRMSDLREFKAGLDARVADPYVRPFVCTGSPLDCRSFIVGINAATRLNTFSSYWSNIDGFCRKKFEADYDKVRSRRGNRPVIEAIAGKIGPCLETNLYAIPTKKAKQLTNDDRQNPIICYLFRAIRPELVFVHSKAAISFFEEKTGCSSFTSEVKRARWQGHDFWPFGRPGPLWTLRANATAFGAKLATYLGR